MISLAPLIEEIVKYENSCPARVGHMLKVYGFAKAIGELEKLDADTLFILETLAITHDVGIKTALEKYGSEAGEYQQKEGPPIARDMLKELGFKERIIDRVCYVISRHHTYHAVDGKDFQILVEADFLVNIHENDLPPESIQSIYKSVFKTDTGKRFLREMYFKVSSI